MQTPDLKIPLRAENINYEDNVDLSILNAYCERQNPLLPWSHGLQNSQTNGYSSAEKMRESFAQKQAEKSRALELFRRNIQLRLEEEARRKRIDEENRAGVVRERVHLILEQSRSRVEKTRVIPVVKETPLKREIVSVEQQHAHALATLHSFATNPVRRETDQVHFREAKVSPLKAPCVESEVKSQEVQDTSNALEKPRRRHSKPLWQRDLPEGIRVNRSEEQLLSLALKRWEMQQERKLHSK